MTFWAWATLVVAAGMVIPELTGGLLSMAAIGGTLIVLLGIFGITK